MYDTCMDTLTAVAFESPEAIIGMRRTEKKYEIFRPTKADSKLIC